MLTHVRRHRSFAFVVARRSTGSFNTLTGFRFLSRMAQQIDLRDGAAAGLIFLVLGTIFIGVATPTEGGAMGAAGALILGAREAPA